MIAIHLVDDIKQEVLPLLPTLPYLSSLEITVFTLGYYKVYIVNIVS